jgi:hypothetical protein
MEVNSPTLAFQLAEPKSNESIEEYEQYVTAYKDPTQIWNGLVVPVTYKFRILG